MADLKQDPMNVAERTSSLPSKSDMEGGVPTMVSESGEMMEAIDPKAERKLVWKLDLKILPVLAVVRLAYNLDNGNC